MNYHFVSFRLDPGITDHYRNFEIEEIQINMPIEESLFQIPKKG